MLMSTDAKILSLSFVSPSLFPGTVRVCVSRDIIYSRNVIRHAES